MTTRILGVLALIATLAPLGCEKKTQQPPLSPPKVATGPVNSDAPATPRSPHTAAPSTPAATSAPTSAPATAPTASSSSVVSVVGVNVPLPASWKRNPPANQMRLAEAEVPGPAGDASKSCLVVFSTAGGSVDENIARWAGQVRDDKGQPATFKPETRTVQGLKITTVRMNGSFAGMGESAAKPNWALQGAIIEAPQGLLFIKMTGPADSINAAAPAFSSMLDGVTKP